MGVLSIQSSSVSWGSANFPAEPGVAGEEAKARKKAESA